MLQSLFRYIKGTIRIRIRGYSLERFINLCKYKNIEMWGLIPNQQSYLLYMYAKDFRRIKPFLRKTKTKVTIEEREGLPFFFYSYKKRLCFWMGFFISLFSFLTFLPPCLLNAMLTLYIIQGGLLFFNSFSACF